MIKTSTLEGSLRAAALIACVTALGLQCTPAAARDLRIDHVTIVSPERLGPMRDATVVIRDDRILSITRHPSSNFVRRPGTTVEVIDGKGLYLAPGLIDSHVHTSGVPGMNPAQLAPPDIAQAARDQIPRSYLYFGFKTLFD